MNTIRNAVKLSALATILTLSSLSSTHAENLVTEDQAKAFLSEHVSSWLNDPTVIDAVKKQNAENSGLSEDDIIALDNKWRADDQEVITKATENALSTFLKDKQNNSDGMFSELFVMDNKGLNVGQSGLTSDYWQGDEAKWQKTYSMGPDALHVSDVEFDESSQTYQVQISTTISDGGSAIGAITVGVDAEFLE